MNKEQCCPVCANPINGHKSFKPGLSVFCSLCQAELIVISKKKETIIFQHLLFLDEEWRQEENNLHYQINEERKNGLELSAQH